MKCRKAVLSALLTCVICVLSVGVALGLGGCAKSDEDQISSMVTSSVEVLKNPTEEKLTPYLEELGTDYSSLETFDTDIYEFLSHSNAKLDCEIESIVIEGGEATVNLLLTNVDLEAASKEASKQITDNLDDYVDLLSQENAETELVKVFVQKYYECVDAATETKTTECALTFSKIDGEWVLDESSYQELLELPLRDVKL